MQPSVALFGMRRFGRHDYSFEPGQSLDDYQVPLDIVDGNRPAEDRFEINHHPYRLQQSPCFQNSSGKLNCLTCHDPHHRVPAGNQVDHYRSACLQCHADDGCDRAERLTPDTGDCVKCHMPRRRTQDVVHVIATDHRIARIPDDSDKRLQELRESEPQIEDVILSPDDRQSNISGVLRAVAILRATSGHHRPAAEHLAHQLARQKIAATEPALDLANAQLVSGQADAALKTLSVVLDQHPTNAQAHEFVGLAKLQQGQIDAADHSLRASLKLDPHRPVAALNLGRLELTRENPQAAVLQLRSVVEAHPTLAAAWYFLGEAHSRQSHWRDASNCYRRALEIDPTLKDAYHGIERALKELGRPEEAARYRRHNARKAAGQ